MEVNFMDDEKLAPEGGDTEGAAADTEGSQPGSEGDAASQQQQQEDPFAKIPYEQARKHYADQFAEEAGQREQLGFGRGQGEARKEVAAIRKKVEGEMADRVTFERLRKMRDSSDPDEKEAALRELDDPDTDAAYRRGKVAASRPAPEAEEKLKFEISDDFLSGLDSHLNDRKELKGLSDEEATSLAKEKHPSLAALVDAKIDLAIKRGIAAGSGKVIKEKEEAARDKLRDEYREKGIEGPEEIEGAAVGAGEDATLAGSATGEQKADAFEKKHGYRPRNI